MAREACSAADDCSVCSEFGIGFCGRPRAACCDWATCWHNAALKGDTYTRVWANQSAGLSARASRLHAKFAHAECRYSVSQLSCISSNCVCTVVCSPAARARLLPPVAACRGADRPLSKSRQPSPNAACPVAHRNGAPPTLTSPRPCAGRGTGLGSVPTLFHFFVRFCLLPNRATRPTLRFSLAIDRGPCASASSFAAHPSLASLTRVLHAPFAPLSRPFHAPFTSQLFLRRTPSRSPQCPHVASLHEEGPCAQQIKCTSSSFLARQRQWALQVRLFFVKRCHSLFPSGWRDERNKNSAWQGRLSQCALLARPTFG